MASFIGNKGGIIFSLNSVINTVHLCGPNKTDSAVQSANLLKFVFFSSSSCAL